MRKTILILSVFSLAAVLASAREPVYVDLAEANQSISDMQAQNDAATQQNNDLNSENDALEQDNQKQRDRIAEARRLIADLSVSRGELYGARNRTNDLDQKKRIVEQLERNMAQENQLRELIAQFNRNIEDNNIKMNANRKQIARNNNTMESNGNEIAYLQACVELTSNNENSLDDIFSRQEGNTSAFDSFVSANQD